MSNFKSAARELMGTKKAVKPKLQGVILDDAKQEASHGSVAYAETDLKLKTATMINIWLETDDLDSGEGYSDRLWALFVGVADEDKNGELSDEEIAVLDLVLEHAWSYFESQGIADDDIESLINGDDNEDVAIRVKDFLASIALDDQDQDKAIDDFVFGSSDQEPLFDAAYKNVMAVRGGKKVRIKKRISGTVRLSSKQKLAIKKARVKSHSAVATMRRMKSMRLRRRSGL